MAHLKGKDDDIDIDYLLETLSPEELEKLGEELIDPDVIASVFLCEKLDLPRIQISCAFNHFLQDCERNICFDIRMPCAMFVGS